MNMKRALSLLLILVTLLTVLPMAAFADNTVSDSATVSVKTGASLNKTKLSLVCGSKYTLKMSNGKKGTWSSSNKSVATVSTSGKVTAKKAGTATITCKVGSKKYTCKVTVKNPVYVSIVNRYNEYLGGGSYRCNFQYKIGNRSSKTISTLHFQVYCYNSSGKTFKFNGASYYKEKATGFDFPGNFSYTFPEVYVTANGYVSKVKAKVTYVKFSDGSTWKP